MGSVRASFVTASVGLLLAVFLLLPGAGVTTACAQTTHASTLKIKQETNKGVRQSKKIATDYKDTHLSTDAHTFKKGHHGRRHFTPRDGYEFDESGYPIIENKPKKKRFFRWKKR